MNKHLFCVAPMMEWTDRHCRYFLRLISKRALLYTEMVTADAVLRGDRNRLLRFHVDEHPVALQVGGSDAARTCRGRAHRRRVRLRRDQSQCRLPVRSRAGGAVRRLPDGRARAGRRPDRGDGRTSAKVPVTVKCRIGIDDQDAEESLDRFIDAVAQGGCRTFILHARKAWLEGLSPKENRDVPPIDYDRVYRMKARRPDLTIIVNGGIGSFSEAEEHLTHVDGVMLGRAAYQDPYILAEVDRRLFGKDEPAPSRLDVLDSFMPYVEAELARGVRLNQMTRHILGLFHGQPRARAFRRVLAENAHLDGAGIDVLKAARDVAAGETRHAVAAE